MLVRAASSIDGLPGSEGGRNDQRRTRGQMVSIRRWHEHQCVIGNWRIMGNDEFYESEPLQMGESTYIFDEDEYNRRDCLGARDMTMGGTKKSANWRENKKRHWLVRKTIT